MPLHVAEIFSWSVLELKCPILSLPEPTLNLELNLKCPFIQYLESKFLSVLYQDLEWSTVLSLDLKCPTFCN